MSVSVIFVLLATGFPLLGVGVDRLLKFYWKDARTRKHRRARVLLIVVSVLAGIVCCLAAIRESIRSEQQRQRLAQALKEADIERRTHALEGRFEDHEGRGQMYEVGNSESVICVVGGGSVLHILRETPLRKIAEENSIESKTVAGKLLVSAKIRGRDGLLAEINDNEWKVTPAPKSWDRNYSTNALEVKDSEGSIVFQIKLVAGVAGLPVTSIVSFQCILCDSDGNWVGFVGGGGKGRGAMTFGLANSTIPIPRIKPLFKYPSSLHLGELAE